MRPIALLAPLCALLLTACGGSDAASDDGPAQLAPAGAQVYVEAVVRPEGAQREGVLAAIGKVMDTDDPEAKLDELLETTTDETEIDFARDVEPWLGERVGIWVDDISPEKASFAIVAQADDAAEGLEALERSARDAGEKIADGVYEGEEFFRGIGEDENYVAGTAGEFVVLAMTEADYKRTVDAADGETLSESDRYEEAIDELPEDALVSYWVDPSALAPLFTADMSAEDAQLFDSLYDLEGAPPTTGALTADGDRVAFDSVGSFGDAKLGGLASFGQGTELVGEVPADAWGAAGIPDLGETAKGLLDTFAGALGSGVLEGQLEEQTGLNLERDIFSWLGDVAFFVSGVGTEELRGGAVIEATDGEKAADAFGKLMGVAKTQIAPPTRLEAVEIGGAEAAFELTEDGMGAPMVVARSSDRVVITYGREAAEAALGDGEKLADAGLWSDATSVLGDDDLAPSFLLDVRKVLENVEASGAEDPDFAKARPYLDALTVLVAGAEVDDDDQQSRLAVGLGD